MSKVTSFLLNLFKIIHIIPYQKFHKMRYTLYILAAMLLFACNGSQTTKQIEIVDNNASSILNKASWLLGAWQGVMEDITMVESWTKQNDTSFVGNAVFTRNGDTLSAESLLIKIVGQDMFYCPTVTNQNDGKTIEFKLTTATDTSLVFENPAHDFPQKISYVKHSDKNLTAEASGMVNGKMERQAFPMSRVQ